MKLIAGGPKDQTWLKDDFWISEVHISKSYRNLNKIIKTHAVSVKKL